MIKRTFDIMFAICGVVLLMPILLFIGLLIRIDSRGPALFCQQRVGRHGKLFEIYKFRTMFVGSEKTGLNLTVDGDKRITRVGTWLRRYKLDELPQLFNVLNGDMSFVGPRPEVPEFVEYYPAELRKEIFSIRPGITDEASLYFKDESKILARSQQGSIREAYIQDVLPRKVEYYIRYVHQQSTMGDLGIIFRTIWAILVRN